MKKLLITVITLFGPAINAINEEMQFPKLGANLISMVASHLDLKEMVLMSQMNKVAESQLHELINENQRKAFLIESNLIRLLNASVLRKSESESVFNNARIEELYGVSLMPIPELLDKTIKFIEKNASSLNPKIRIKTFTFPVIQNKNYGSVPERTTGAEHFVGTLVTESYLQMRHGLMKYEVDLILSMDHQSIIGFRTIEGLTLFKDQHGAQYKVSNTYQNRALAFILSFNLPENRGYVMNLLLPCCLDVHRVPQHEVVGFFHNRDSIMDL